VKIQVSVLSSQKASVYSIGVQASSWIDAIAHLMVEVRRTVTDTSTPARIAGPMVGWP
jgi:hypothetical protein